MTIKFPLSSVTVYENEPIKTEPLESTKDEFVGDACVDIFETDYKNIVQKFNRVALLVDGMI